MTDTTIQWTDKTWDPVRGCSLVSLAAPLKWKKPCRIFVNSMSDLFHEDVPDEFLDRVFAVMTQATRHTYQVLTKRPERMQRYVVDWCRRSSARLTPNVWLGVSVEDQQRADERIPLLLQTPAAVRFLSCEPLLEHVDLTAVPRVDTEHPHPAHYDLADLDWVILGGESGPGARPFDIEWGRAILRQCKAAGVPAFMKQTGSNVRVPRADCLQFAAKGSWRADSQGSPYGVARPFDRAGGDPMEWTPDLRVREFPAP